MVSAMRICSACGSRFDYVPGKECPNCANWDKKDATDKASLLSFDKHRSNEDWIAEYASTFNELPQKEKMTCEANGIQPEIIMLDKRCRVLMSMIIELKTMLKNTSIGDIPMGSSSTPTQ